LGFPLFVASSYILIDFNVAISYNGP